MQDSTKTITYHSLLQERQGRGFSESEVTEILRQIIPQVVQDHNRGEVHSAISPATLEQNPVTRQSVLIPAQGITPPGYTAPEQIQTGMATIASDIYALGVTAIVLLSGKNPEQLHNYDGTWNWQDYCVVSDQFAAAVERAITAQPQYRYSNAMQMLQALNTPPVPISPPPQYPVGTTPIGVYPQTVQSNIPQTLPQTLQLNQKTAIILGSILGATILLSIILVKTLPPGSQTPDPPATPQASTSSPSSSQADEPSITESQAVQLISDWLRAKSRVFSSPYDRQIADEYTTAVLYRDITKPGGSLDWLRDNNAYYVFGVQKVEPTGTFTADGDRATIEVRVTEDRTFYVNGKVDNTQTDFDTKSVRYTLYFTDGRWKIADYK